MYIETRLKASSRKAAKVFARYPRRVPIYRTHTHMVVPPASRVCNLRVHAHTASQAAPRSRAKWACGRRRRGHAPYPSSAPSPLARTSHRKAMCARCEPRTWTSSRRWPRSTAGVASSRRAAAAANSAWLIRLHVRRPEQPSDARGCASGRPRAALGC